MTVAVRADHPTRDDIRRDPNHHLASEAPCPCRHGNFVLGFEAMPVVFTPALVEAFSNRRILA